MSIDDFIINKKLGSGANGKVYLAITKDNEQVALKFSKNVRNEVCILRDLDHPNIIKLFDYFVYKSKNVLVLEYTPYGDMLNLLEKEGSISIPKTSKYIKQLCIAASYIHNKNIVHRDIKLENILLFENDKIKLTDFDNAIYIKSTSDLMRLAGTVHCLAPESIEKREYTHSVDIWAIGIITYELIYGYTPFDADSRYDIINKIKMCKYEFPYPTDKYVKNFISNILVKNVSDRLTIKQMLKHSFLK